MAQTDGQGGLTRRSLLAVVALAAAQVVAQPVPPAASPDEIVVQARERRAIENFVKGIADPARSGQLARWEDGVCSGVIGLQADQAELLNGRIGELAGLAGLQPGKAGCRPSILIIFSHDARALAQGFAQRFPVTLGHEGRWRLEAFARSERPVRWIGDVEEAPFDGSRIANSLGTEPPTGRMSNSRIQQSTRAVLTFMLVIVDAKQIEHVSLASLSDYLALVALARPRFGDKPPQQSVLALFDGKADAALTDFDRAYLASMYKAPADRNANAQAAGIASRMRHAPASSEQR